MFWIIEFGVASARYLRFLDRSPASGLCKKHFLFEWWGDRPTNVRAQVVNLGDRSQNPCKTPDRANLQPIASPPVQEKCSSPAGQFLILALKVECYLN